MKKLLMSLAFFITGCGEKEPELEEQAIKEKVEQEMAERFFRRRAEEAAMKKVVERLTPEIVESVIQKNAKEIITPSAMDAEIRKSIEGSVPTAVDAAVTARVGEVVPGAVDTEVQTTAREKVPGAVDAEIRKSIEGSVPTAVDAAVTTRVGEIVPDAVDTAVQTTAREKVPGVVEAEIRKSIEGFVPTAVDAAVTARVREVVPGAVDTEVQITARERVPGVVEAEVGKSIEGSVPTAVDAAVTARVREVVPGAVDTEVQTAVGEKIPEAVERTPIKVEGVAVSGTSEGDSMEAMKVVIVRAIEEIVKNSKRFLDDEIKFEKIVERALKEENIQWSEITTREDIEQLADQLVNTMYRDEKYKYTIVNFRNALIFNIKPSIRDIPFVIEGLINLKADEKIKLNDEINIEFERVVDEFVDERMRYALGRAIDAEISTEAIYTLQFDINSAPLQRDLGKIEVNFISVKGEEEGFYFSTKGDCVRIKKEHLSSIALVLMYTSPAQGMNHPSAWDTLCNQEEKRKCQAGHYSIKKIGSGPSTDYILQWEKSGSDRSLSCPEFPTN